MKISEGQLIIRPVCEDDLDSLMELLESIPDSITSLQPNRKYIEDRIHQSLRAFYPVVDQPGLEKYFFVLEDLKNNCLAGTCSIYAKTGGFEPFYTYEIVDEPHNHEPLGIETHISSLHLRTEHEGPSELGGLFLHHDYRGGGTGGSLSRSRFLFAKAFPDRFTPEIMAEFRGVVTKSGNVPFWEAIGRHFFVRDFASLDQYSAVSRKDFIHDLMPRHPIYVPLLPKKARAVVGKPHPNAEPAVHVLKNEGFSFINHVDIFDAGPLYQATLKDTKSFKSCQRVKLSKVANSLPKEKASSGLLSTVDLSFRAAAGMCIVKDGSITISKKLAESLCVEPGEELQFLPQQS